MLIQPYSYRLFCINTLRHITQIYKIYVLYYIIWVNIMCSSQTSRLFYVVWKYIDNTPVVCSRWSDGVRAWRIRPSWTLHKRIASQGEYYMYRHRLVAHRLRIEWGDLVSEQQHQQLSAVCIAFIARSAMAIPTPIRLLSSVNRVLNIYKYILYIYALSICISKDTESLGTATSALCVARSKIRDEYNIIIIIILVSRSGVRALEGKLLMSGNSERHTCKGQPLKKG